MSYALTYGVVPISDTNAHFQAWGKSISDALANSGWIKWADANVGAQINWATVPAPTTNNASAGYEIWSMGDSQQATTPIVLKIEYGSASSGAGTLPQIYTTVGSSANSSGGIPGNTIPQTLFTLSGTNTSPQTSYYSGSPSRFNMAWSPSAANYSLVLGIERTLDTSGAYSTEGCMMIKADTAGTANRWQVAWTPSTGNVTAWETSWGILMPGAVANSSFRMGQPTRYIAAYPCFFSAGTLMNPCTMVMGYFVNDYTTGTLLPYPVYGANVTYVPLGNLSTYGASVRGGTRTCLMMRYD